MISGEAMLPVAGGRDFVACHKPCAGSQCRHVPLANICFWFITLLAFMMLIIYVLIVPNNQWILVENSG